MTEEFGFEDQTIAPLLHRFAIETSSRKLAILIVGGVAAACLAYWSAALGSVFLLSAGTATAMLGVWALTERALSASPDSGRAVVIAIRAMANLVGVIGALGAALAGTGVLLGRWIS